MRKYLPTDSIRKIILLLFVAVSLASPAMAQSDIVIGTGTDGNSNTGYPCPLQDWYEGSRMQYLYPASELAAAGMGPGNITAIKFNVISLASSSNSNFEIQQYTIKIGTTASSSLSEDSWENVSTTVYGPVNYTATVGVNTFNFTTPFFWNGTDNIVIEVCNGDPGNSSGTFYTGNPKVTWTENLSFNGSHSYHVDNAGNVCGTPETTNYGDQTTRPNIVFSWTAAAACTGTPVAGTAETSSANVCFGESFDLHLTGTTVASGLTYQWQSSPDNTAWTDITGATSAAFSTTQTASSYYRCKVTCTNGGAFSYSTSVSVSSPALVSGTYTINKAQPTGGTNFNSFNDAYNFMKCGIGGPIVFNVVAGSGPYNEQLIMMEVPGASAVNIVTFNGNGNTITYASSGSSERATIKLNGADHVSFDNLVVEATGSYGFGVQLLNDADSNTISNCTINIPTTSSSTNYAGISISHSATSATSTGETKCDGNIINHNTVTGGYYGVTLVGSSTVANMYNQITNNTIRDFYLYGIYVNGSFSALIENNTITRPARTSVSTFYGIYSSSLNTKLNITRNRITNPFGGNTSSSSTFYGIYFSSTDAIATLENVVSNNLIYGLNGAGDQYGIYNSGSDNVWYYHNTISMDGTGAGTADDDITRGFYQTTTAAGIEFKNNIITISRGGVGEKHAIYFNTSGSSVISDYNDYYIFSSDGDNFFGYNGSDQLNLGAWQTASMQDAHSIYGNPRYADEATGNYKPTNASVNNLGTPIAAVTVDIDGVARDASTPDMGAYEFTPAPCTVPPTPGTATVSVSPICAETSVALGLTGNSIGLTQTYQWESSTSATGPFTPLGAVLTNPDTVIISSATLYYRVAVTCSGNTAYSTPVLLEVNPRLPAGTYTIDPAGSGPNNYVDFNAAKAALSCGIAGPIVFNVAPNSPDFNEQLILDSIAGTSATNTIIFNGNGNKIHYSSSTSAERAVIKLNGADHIIFDSLTIDATGSGSYGFGVQLINNADSNIFRKCNIITETNSTSTGYAGIVVSNSATSATTSGETWCDGNLFESNTVTGGYYGITLVGSTSAAPIEGNRVIGNTVREFYYYGIYALGTLNTHVEHNLLTRPTRSNVSTFYGIYFTSESNGAVVAGNTLTNPFGGELGTTSAFYGIYFSSSDASENTPNKVYNNIIYNVNGDGIVYGLYNYSSDNVEYYHNTISIDYAASTTSSTARGFYQSLDATGIVLKNNIITVTRGGSGDKYAVYFSSTGSDITADHNDYYVSETGTNNYIGYYSGDKETLADWQTASGQDAHSINEDPVYADPANGNMRPVISPLDNLGEYVGIPADILGAARSTTTPDIGAYEFAIPPCVAPPVAGAAIATPNAGICLGTRIQLNLTGNTAGGGQTFQWQNARDAAGPWTNLGDVRYVAKYKTDLTANNYFRCIITCTGMSDTSGVVHVAMNPPFMGGTYTIDPAQPTGGINFQTFGEAVAALECGIDGNVIFNVAPGTYTEQVYMHKIAGTSDTARVTFQSANGDPASVTLTYTASDVDSNYVVKLDGASYITWRALTIKPLDDDYGRGFVLDGKASYDSIVNCIIVLPTASSSSDDISGVYADALSGEYNVIAGNNITNGANGIYLRATSAALHTSNNVIDSNTVTGAYYYSIYISNNERIRVTKNTVNISAPRNSTSYGIYSTGSDSAYVYTGNTVNISNTTTTVYGMYFTGCDASKTERGRVEANKIIAVTGNTGTLYGMYHSSSDNINNLNNVIALATSGSTTYGIYCTSGSGAKYYNNSVRTSSSSNTNRTAYFSTSSSTYGPTDIRNNIFSNEGDGAAMYIGNTNHIYSDYNMFYTTGSTLIEWGSNDYATLQEWRDTAYWDIHSIVYKPAFTSATDLMPDVNDPNVWAIHGRGVQIEGNSYDFNNNDRPVTLQAGVPDLGAYEFVPSSIPVELTATPADPAPGTTQVFMLGTDTVTKITWAPGSTVPTTITGRRYSGVVPPGLATGTPFMYFYTDFDTTGTAPANYSIEQFYLDPWQGLINSQRIIKMGRTLSGGNWFVSSNSAVNELTSTISESQLSFIDKFTGLTDGTAAAPPPSDLITTDSSNRGTRFWVAYGHHYDFSSNSQDMVLYLSAEEAANVQVKINGTSWVRNYSIPANTAIVSDVIPKSGLIDARITDEGLFNNAISIVSDVPIVAYAHIYNGSNSGAGMLLPVGVYGYDYTSLNSHQYYPGNAYSWFYIIADRDSTMVEITPSVTTKHGRPANTPFIVMLNKGQVYNVMGTTDGSLGSDLTGSRIRSIPNASGKCQPIAVFSGSSRTALCNTTNGDNFIQQVFPNTAWGTKYLTFATANSTSDNEYNSNIFRVMVKDPATHVTLNGNLLDPATLVVPGNYYEFSTTQGNGPNGAINIESNKPVLMAQYMVSTNAHQCTGVTADGDGDPELIYISPVQQGIKKAVFYNTDESSINSNYINVVVPTAGLSTLTIDGASTFTDVFVHPYDSNYTCVRYNLGDTAGQHIIQCDSAFTAITYGLGLVESYGYNAGTLVKNLNAYTSIANTLADGSVSDYTCPGAPFRFSMKLNLKPNTIVWHFSQVSNLTPNADVSQSNPVPTDSALVNGAWYYTYVLPQDYVYSSTTAFVVPISISHPDIESCNNSMDITLQVPVKPKPFTDFDTTFSGCVSDPVQFSGISNPYPGATVNKWTWDFGDATADSVQNPVKQYLAPGTYNVKLQAIGTDGCIGDTIKPVVVNGPAAVELEEDSIIACLGSDVTFRVANPSASVTYNWYDSLSAGTLLGTGDSYTIPAISSAATIYVEAVEAGCAGFPRAKAVLMVSPPLTKPVAAVDSVGTDLVRFRWNAVPNATGYEVSIDNGLNWITPSSGPNGLIHLVTGLQSNQTITLMVKAKGCEDMVSDPVSGTTVPDGIFIPNAFTPNGDGLNDVLKVYSYLIKDMHFMVFNQWGEKIFESTNQSVAWDGSYKGMIQPSGVYMYVCRMTLKDGRVITKKGAINLVR